MLNHLKQHSPVIVLFIITGILAYFGEEARIMFRFDVDQQEAGQWWRLLTANLVHTNLNHWLLNSAGLLMIWWIFQGQLKPQSWTLLLIIMAPLHLALLYWLAPDLKWYVGLSGLLHAWLAAAAVFDTRGHYWVGYFLLAGLIGKVTWEFFYGASAQVSEFIEASIATEAHLAGIIVGIIFGLLWPGVICVHCDQEKSDTKPQNAQ